MVVWSLEGYDLIVTKEGTVFVFEVSSCSSKCLAIVTKKFQWWVKGPPSKDEWQRPPCYTANMCYYMLYINAASDPTIDFCFRHTFDQKRLKQPLYRHPWEDVLYTK